MTIVYSNFGVGGDYGAYVSHSMNQHTINDDDKIITLNHGDGYPRGIVLSDEKFDKNTGTPIAENPSAITFKVTVFPLPVAPAMSPCLFAILDNKTNSLSPFFAINTLLSFIINAPKKNSLIKASMF